MPNPETLPLRVVVYYRTGTPFICLEKQHAAVERYGWFRRVEELLEFTEIEERQTQYRPQLALAISEADRLGADLLIAEIDLLSRNVQFLEILAQAKRERGLKFLACGSFSNQYLDVEFMLIHAAFDGQIRSQRTKEGLAAAKSRGVIIGAAGAAHTDVASAAWSAKAADGRKKHLSIIAKIRRTNPDIKTFQGMADALTAQGVKTPAGLDKWSPVQVRRIVGPKRKKTVTLGEAPAHPEKALRTDGGKARVLH